MEEMNKDVIAEKREEGATMVEYALMAALVAIVCIAAVTVLGRQVSSQFSNIASVVGTAPSS